MGSKGCVFLKQKFIFMLVNFGYFRVFPLKLPCEHEACQAKKVAVRGRYVHGDRHSNSVCQ